MRQPPEHYINGRWIAVGSRPLLDVVNPLTEELLGRVAVGTADDVDAAVNAARVAFASFSQTSRKDRIDLLDAIIAQYERRFDELADLLTQELGAPPWLSRGAQVPAGLHQLTSARDLLRTFDFEEQKGPSLIVREGVGVCAVITPWNWPINQLCAKFAPAIAVGCTVVAKPSEMTPFTAQIIAEIVDAAGVPPGVFNMVHGDGATTGAALSGHYDVDAISFTGSTRAGAAISEAAAATIKRVHLELGGKSPNIILPGADLKAAVPAGVQSMMLNSGQSCTAPSRMLVHRADLEQALDIAKGAMADVVLGASGIDGEIGPMISKAHWTKVQGYIEQGVAEGATVAIGGLGVPEAVDKGFYVKPTIFSGATNDMAIAREEIFGPVLTIIAYDDIDEAVEIANDTPYGLSAYVSGDPEQARVVAKKLRAGQVYVNYPAIDMQAPFGGYKQSGNGREWGEYAFDAFLEIKAVMG